MKKVFVLIGLGLTLIGCNQPEEVINIYSGRHYQTDEDLFQKFTEETGIHVNLIKANSDQLINRLEMEGSRSPADILITADAGRLISAYEKGLLQPINSERIKKIVPANFRDKDNFWTGFSMRARVIIYHKQRINPETLSSYEQLTNATWRNKLLVRSSQNHYNQTLMASIVAAKGEDEAIKWAKGVVDNMARKPVGNDRDQIKGVAANVGNIAIANTYYIGLMLNSPNQEERNVAKQMGIFFPNQNDRGTHVNISGIAITVNAPNYNNAIKLIEFMLNDESQQYLAENNYEYPINPNIEWPQLLKEWGTFKSDTLPLHLLGQHLNNAMIIFNKAGWE